MRARIDGLRPRTTVLAILIAGFAAALALLAAPDRLAAQTDAPPPEALEKLQEMEDKILRAKAKSDRGAFRDALELTLDARDDKFDFISAGFGREQEVHGCAANAVISGLELIDSYLSFAIAEDRAHREENLRGASDRAGRLIEVLEDCASERARAIAAQIKDATERFRDQFEKGKLSTEKLRKGTEGVSVLKRELVSGSQVYGCDVLEYFLLIQSIDRALDSAAGLPERQDELRGTLLRKAAKKGNELIERWRMVPCGGATPPPPDGEFTARSDLSWFHANGFGNPPSRECNFVSTSPAQAGAQVTDVITRPSPQSQVTKTATTDSSGGTVISMDIDTTGTYTHETTVTNAGGSSVTVTSSQTVTGAQTGANGQCPEPTS